MENGEIKNLYSDRARSKILLPKTKTKAVSNEEGINLDVLLEDKASKVFVTEKIAEAQLGGEIDLSDYVTKEDLAKITPEDIGAVPAITTSQIYIAAGEILTSTGTARGCGTAIIYISPDGIARVDYSIKINVAGTDSSLFRVGIDASALSLLNTNVPAITPVTGVCTYYKADGTINTTLTGFGGRAGAADNRWALGRTYTTSGSYGSWPDSQFGEGMFITGTNYGKIS